MQKFFIPLKVKKSCIALRSIGNQELMEEAIARIREQDALLSLQDECGDLVLLSGAPTVPLPPIPAYIPVKVNYLQAFPGIIRKETLNLIKI